MGQENLKVADKNLKPEELYRHLKDLAEKMDITVCEHSFRHAGIPVKSGLCKIKGRHHFIINKDLPIRKKNKLLTQCLRAFSHEEVFILPAVRDLF